MVFAALDTATRMKQTDRAMAKVLAVFMRRIIGSLLARRNVKDWTLSVRRSSGFTGASIGRLSTTTSRIAEYYRVAQ